jgi:hypothetical protein
MIDKFSHMRFEPSGFVGRAARPKWPRRI